MSEYILENLKMGKINSQAISKYNIRELRKHAKSLINKEVFILNEDGKMRKIL